MTALLKLDSITKRFGTIEAIQAISFEVFPRRNTAILGRSGSGKSTLLRIIAGLETPDGGNVWINDRQVTAEARIVVPPHRRGIALVFQNLALWPNLTVLGNVLLGLESSGLSRTQRFERAREALTVCELAGMERRRPESLSGGQQQRAALARAFAVHPRLLLLDEPFSGLDILLKRSLIDHIRRSVRQLDTTVLLVTHDPSDAVELCTSAVVIENGRLEEHGPLSELLENPASEILKTFVAQARTGPPS